MLPSEPRFVDYSQAPLSAWDIAREIERDLAARQQRFGSYVLVCHPRLQRIVRSVLPRIPVNDPVYALTETAQIVVLGSLSPFIGDSVYLYADINQPKIAELKNFSTRDADYPREN